MQGHPTEECGYTPAECRPVGGTASTDVLESALGSIPSVEQGYVLILELSGRGDQTRRQFHDLGQKAAWPLDLGDVSLEPFAQTGETVIDSV
jgi:hypothetical protein